MPYILVRGDLTSHGHKTPWRVQVSGLQAADIEQLKRFACGGFCDSSTIVYLQHPCVLLTALEVLGYKVVASSSTAVKQDFIEYMWTMRREFDEPEPCVVVEQENISNINKEALGCSDNVKPEKGTFVYIAVRGSLHSSDCSAFGLNEIEEKAMNKRFTGGQQLINGVLLKGHVLKVINSLSELGYEVIASSGETEITWTLRREI